MAKFRMILAAMVALAAMAAAAHSQELLTVDDGKKGINALGAERNRWRPQGLEATKGGKFEPSWYRSLDNLDFFVLEYGKPCEAMDFAVPEEKNAVWSKHWGYSPESHEAGIRLGRGWENYMMCQWAVEMDVEQDAEETSWRLDEITTLGKRTDRHDFKVTGRGRQKFCKNLALIRKLVRLSQVSGLELYCQTPGAKGRIHSLRLVPRVVTITWKRTFDLDDKPVRTGLRQGRRLSAAFGKGEDDAHCLLPRLEEHHGGVRERRHGRPRRSLRIPRL